MRDPSVSTAISRYRNRNTNSLVPKELWCQGTLVSDLLFVFPENRTDTCFPEIEPELVHSWLKKAKTDVLDSKAYFKKLREGK